MGKGAVREAVQDNREIIPLNTERATRLSAALEKLDRIKPAFKSARDEERYAQMSKTWHRLCSEMDGNLRLINKGLHQSHQLSLDVGSDGGGINTKPFVEEIANTFERIVFRLEGTRVLAVSGGQILLEGPPEDVNYEWLERALIEWIVFWSERGKR